MKRTVLASAVLLVIAACVNHVAVPPVQQVPPSLQPAANEKMVGAVAARGVQIYECRARKDDPQSVEWSFVAPEAQLFNVQGDLVGRHYAGPHWESVDGSKVAGSVSARADAPKVDAIPWLLLATKSVGPDGAFARVTSIQRINTEGGAAPASGECKSEWIGRQARIAYSADYVMFGSN
jgi:hypothetical protein